MESSKFIPWKLEVWNIDAQIFGCSGQLSNLGSGKMLFERTAPIPTCRGVLDSMHRRPEPESGSGTRLRRHKSSSGGKTWYRLHSCVWRVQGSISRSCTQTALSAVMPNILTYYGIQHWNTQGDNQRRGRYDDWLFGLFLVMGCQCY